MIKFGDFLKNVGLAGLINKRDLVKSKRIATMISAGDSIVEYQGTFGQTFAPTVNVTGVEIRYASLKCAAGNMTLAWNVAASTLTFTAPGDTAGTPVVVSDGLYLLPSGDPTIKLRVGVYSRLLPATNQSDTLASAGLNWRRGRGSWQYVIDAFTNRRFQMLEDLGIAGNYSSDLVKRYAQVIGPVNSSIKPAEIGIIPDIIIDETGTNDIVAGSQTAASVIANRTACWDVALAAGKRVIGLLVSPRFGSTGANGVAGNDPGTLATQGPIIVRANIGLAAAAKSVNRNGILLADNFSKLVDPATGRVRNYSSVDGVHNAGDGAIEYAMPIITMLDVLSPDVQSHVVTGTGSYYNASTNPGGNLLSAGQGDLAGTGGTLGTGAALTPAWATATSYTALTGHVINGGNLYQAMNSGTSGATAPTHISGIVSDGTVNWLFLADGVTSGFAAGYTVQRSVGSALQILCHKVAAKDGGPDWQEFISFGATRDVTTTTPEEYRVYPGFPTIGNFTVGDTIDTSVVPVYPYGREASTYGIYMDQIYTGQTITHDNQALWSCYRGIRYTKPFTLALEPIEWLSSITAVLPRVIVQAKNGAVSYVRLRQFDMHKVQ